ncbi:hypothetical protein [Cohnella terricola]|uniref:hypothetical protein n=1 Tax=Cohnella terricola TaxID=1289167 RepID=UPI003CCC57F6
MATAIPWESKERDFLLHHASLRTRSHKPLIVNPNGRVEHQMVMLHEPRQDDTPILVSLPLLMNNFLKRVGQQ